MRVFVRSVGVALLVIGAAVGLALTQTMTSVFTLAALMLPQTYIVRGTQYAFPACAPFCGTLVTPQQNINLATPYIIGTVGAGTPRISVVNYPASFWPISVGYLDALTYNQSVAQGVAALPPPNGPNGIGSGSVIFGYSQGADVATIYKRNFNAAWASNPAGAPAINFVLIGNPNRPNGGILERFNGLYIPILNVSFNGATPTTTAGATSGQITTYDIARQYDGNADFPTNPLNLLADANALAGMQFVHLNYQGANMSQAVYQGTTGDTAYYLIPTYPLPLLMPLELIPGVGPVLVDTLDPALRVLVEAGYNRTINPGAPTPANFLYFPNPATFGTSLLVAIPTGLGIGLQDIMGTRTPGTPPPGFNPYGIGGGPVLLPGQPPDPLHLPPPSPPSPPPDLFATTAPAQNVSAVNQTATAPSVQTIDTPPPPVASMQTVSKSVIKPIWPDMTSGNKVSPSSTSAGTGTSSSGGNPLTGALAGVTNAVTSAIGSLTGGLTGGGTSNGSGSTGGPK